MTTNTTIGLDLCNKNHKAVGLAPDGKQLFREAVGGVVVLVPGEARAEQHDVPDRVQVVEIQPFVQVSHPLRIIIRSTGLRPTVQPQPGKSLNRSRSPRRWGSWHRG